MTVYIIQAFGTDLYKVGYTSGDVKVRLDQLQTGCPYKLKIYKTLNNASRLVETELISKLSGYESGGGDEWYKVSLAFLDQAIDELNLKKNSSGDEDELKIKFDNCMWEMVYGDPEGDIDDEIAKSLYWAREFGKSADNVKNSDGPGWKTIEFSKPYYPSDEAWTMLEKMSEEYGITMEQSLSRVISLSMKRQFQKRAEYLDEIAKLRKIIKERRRGR